MRACDLSRCPTLVTLLPQAIDHEGVAAHGVTTGLAKKGIALKVEAGKKPLQMVVYALVSFIQDLQVGLGFRV